MKLATPAFIENLFYLSVDFDALPGDEQFGLSIGPWYLGLYESQFFWGRLDLNGSLIDNDSPWA